MTNKWLLFLLMMLSFRTSIQAQYYLPQNRTWVMGNNVGLNFNTNPPSVMQTVFSSGNEGCASVSDSNGKLLFYTNGTRVWYADGTLMPAGDTIIGRSSTTSTTQGAVIIPDPGNPMRYYIFSLTAVSNCKLYSNIVDMSLNNGKGDIDLNYAYRGRLLKDSLTEKMIAARGCHDELWLLVHSENKSEFYSYHISPSGLNLTPVVSKAGNFPGGFYLQGVMKLSPKGNRVLTCNFRATANLGRGLELFDFDINTGQLSNASILDSAVYYGGTFSPDGSKVYGQTTTGSEVFQFDLSAADPSATKIRLGPSGQYADMKIGPDGKIYFGALVGSPGYNNYRFMGRINYPDSAGLACQFQDSVTTLYFPNAGQTAGLLAQGLPNEVVVPIKHIDYNTLVLDTIVCDYSTVVLSAPSGFSEYIWDDGLQDTLKTINRPGTYWVSYTSGKCYTYRDSFIVKGNDLFTTITIKEFQLGATGGPFASYQWYLNGNLIEGATEEVYSVTSNGDYTVLITNEHGCSYTSAIYSVTNYTTDITSLPKRNGVEVFPNPVREKLFIRAKTALQLRLFTLDGRIVLNKQHENEIDMTTLPEGMYMLHVLNNEGILIHMEKIVKHY